jgi:hypothetical protein
MAAFDPALRFREAARAGRAAADRGKVILPMAFRRLCAGEALARTGDRCWRMDEWLAGGERMALSTWGDLMRDMRLMVAPGSVVFRDRLPSLARVA